MGFINDLFYYLMPDKHKDVFLQTELEEQTKLLKEQNKQLEYYKHRESFIKEQNERTDIP